MKIIKADRSFDLDAFLEKPLFAHLSTLAPEGPRDSPVWFHWENKCIWITGNPTSNSFPSRLVENPKCAIGIVDFDCRTGKVLHVGLRGQATVEPFDKEISVRLFTRYLGSDEESWDPMFQNFLNDRNVLIRFVPETVVVRDQSYRPSD